MDFLDHVMELPEPPQGGGHDRARHLEHGGACHQMGATDFLTKPFDAARLQGDASQRRRAASPRQAGPRAQRHKARGLRDFIGASAAMQSVYRTIDSLAPSDATGFIVGESGTGKELAAEAIHAPAAARRREFVAINCGAIPGELMESELFGHVKGAFTGASANREGAASVADGGTLFLDEICEMDLELQKKLLRFIQTGTFRKVGSNTLETVDVRFVCATNRDPLLEVREGRFREDLFYRLHVVPCAAAAARARRDVLLIARHFLERFARRPARLRGFSPPRRNSCCATPGPATCASCRT
jgi:two-component system repressor protein LuxO